MKGVMVRLRVRGAQKPLQMEGSNGEQCPLIGLVENSQNPSHNFCHVH